MEILLLILLVGFLCKTIFNIGRIIPFFCLGAFIKIVFNAKVTLILVATPLVYFFIKGILKSLKLIAFYISKNISYYEGDIFLKASYILLEVNYVFILSSVLFLNLFNSLESNSIVYFMFNGFNVILLYILVRFSKFILRKLLRIKRIV